MVYSKYAKYKTGIYLIDAIPNHWHIFALRRFLHSHKQGYYTTDAYVDEGVKLLRITDLSGKGSIDVSKCPKVPESDPTLKNYELINGDIVFARTGGAGSFGVVQNLKERIVFASYLIRFRFNPRFFIKNFIPYMLSSDSFQELLKMNIHGGVNQNIHAEDIKRTYLIYPPLDEQNCIATFLDKKTAEIDALISKKQTLIKLLSEKRAAFITQAITKGLNYNVVMKDSKIDWLGVIPKKWNLKRLKFCVVLVNDKKNYEDLNLIYMGLEHIESWTGKRLYDDTATSDGVVCKFKPEDVLFGKLRPYLAKVYLAQEEGCASTEVLVLRSSEETYPAYLQYFMLMPEFINAVDASTYGAKMPRANWEFIGNQLFTLPPFSEQKLIARFLDEKIGEIDTTCTKIMEAIDSLKEYRSVLITNVVTGKIDVSNSLEGSNFEAKKEKVL